MSWRKRRAEGRDAPRRGRHRVDDPDLQTLRKAAKQDRALRDFFQQLGKLPEDRREALLDRLLASAAEREAPEAFRQAVARLRDPAVLQHLLRVL